MGFRLDRWRWNAEKFNGNLCLISIKLAYIFCNVSTHCYLEEKNGSNASREHPAGFVQLRDNLLEIALWLFLR